MTHTKAFQTERLTIRPTNSEDAAFIYELLNSPKWKRNIGDRNIETLEDAREYINTKSTPQHLRLGYGNYTVIRKEDGRKIGTCGLYDRPGVEGIDIGFAFLPDYEKMGYAFESASKVKQAAIELFGLKKLSAITIAENVPSQRLLEKLGLRFIKTMRIPNDDEELLYYELIID